MEANNPQQPLSTPVSSPQSIRRKRLYSELNGAFFAPTIDRYAAQRENSIMENLQNLLNAPTNVSSEPASSTSTNAAP